MPDEITSAGRCQPGECDHHLEHPHCYRGWLTVDQVCPCWAARRAAEVHHTGPVVASGTPMPASVRAAWNTARKTLTTPSSVIPEWVPAAAAEPVPAKPETPRPPIEPAESIESKPTPDPVLDQLTTTDVTPAQRAQLIAALNTARAAGWTNHQLLAHLRANTDPDRPPGRLWLHVLKPRALADARTVEQAAA